MTAPAQFTGSTKAANSLSSRKAGIFRWLLGEAELGSPQFSALRRLLLGQAMQRTKAQHEIHGWADGTEVISVTSGDQWQNNVEPATFLNGYWKEFMIGWQSFSSAANEIWIDDLVLSPTRVNCL